MVNIRTIRKENLLAQIARFGSQRAFADKAGLAPAHVSQLVTDRRNMGDEVARRIEKNLNLTDGYMDLQHQQRSYPLHLPASGHNRIAENDSEALQALLLKVDQMQQRLTAKTRKVILRIERAAMEGRLSDADWEILERLVDRFEKEL
ncbi:helix-turn-helix transcriptional regulator [Candidatus Thiodiazotropha sp. CDECU1]|uniref:helix-turn-helix transcriptional regulator n=1 Tax=Candidatus Thiodiazotropha sp. CDECU1 TaxID=3065865 RepID=UPI00292F035D|nr:helix-turn-helix transcriptional regulator [Candidatus Thiodiazotropha sp. CDECU1]